jgi:hypothetical protein
MLCGIVVIAWILARTPTAARAADLSKDIRTATDETPYAAQIASYVQGQAKIIGDDADPAETSKARESLVDEVRGLVPPSTQFLDAFESQLNSSLANLLLPTNPVRVRLNAAIIVADVAQVSQDARLAQLVITELKDPSEAVVLWGLKAAHEVIPQALGVPSLKNQLISAVTAAAQRLGTGRIVNAAYYALAVGDKPPAASPADLIAPISSLLDWRIKQYAGAVPPEPPADAVATLFLTEHLVWTGFPARQAGTAQRIVDLIAAANADLSLAQPEDRDQLILLLKKAGQAIYVIGINNGNVALQQASTQLTLVDQRPPPPFAAAAAKAVQGLATVFPALRVPQAFATTASSPAGPAKTTP